MASASRTRADLLGSAGLEFDVMPACIDEEGLRRTLERDGATPVEVAAQLALCKAERVSSAAPEALVIGADQVLELDGEILSKSNTIAEARDVLCRLRGRTHVLHTAAVLARNGAAIWQTTTEARLAMRDFSDAFLDDHLAKESEALLGSVGTYRLEDRGAQLFERVEGDYFSILGLPMILLLNALRDHGAVPQ